MNRQLRFITIAITIIVTGTAMGSWDAYVIRTGSSGAAPSILDNTDYGVPAKEFVISEGGMKAAWGTNELNGLTVGDITRLKIDRLDDYTRFSAGSGPYVAPYFNIWVTNGTDFAVIANEPSNPAFQALFSNGYDLQWSDIADKTVKAYENSDLSWITSLDVGGDGLTFSDVAGLQIATPLPNATWPGLGTGAPRELNLTGSGDPYLAVYGFNWVFGDTLSNYLSGDEGYVVANPLVTSVIPAPGAILLGSLGAGLVGWLRKRKAL